MLHDSIPKVQTVVSLEHGAQPLLGLVDRDVLAGRIRDDLVLRYLADGKVLAALPGKVESTDGRRRLHGKALRQTDARPGLDVH